jgi:hypothetical protein
LSSPAMSSETEGYCWAILMLLLLLPLSNSTCPSRDFASYSSRTFFLANSNTSWSITFRLISSLPSRSVCCFTGVDYYYFTFPEAHFLHDEPGFVLWEAWVNYYYYFWDSKRSTKIGCT